MHYQQKLKRTAWLITLHLLCFMASAQDSSLSGKVLDKNGEPMIGVNVTVKGSGTGTITNMDGEFILSNLKKSTLISFSYIGYKSKEITYKGEKTIQVILEEDSELLNEVVVIGYGTVNKRDLTGSVSSVKADDLKNIPVSNATEALTGKLAGVSVTTTDGAPEGDVNIRVRGGGSLSQDNSPLYIVDGFPVSSISDISPNEIESIDVLKDASSTAIYGARGANGVIIVTTKEGHEGKTEVNFGASFGLRKVAKLQKTISPYDYVIYQREAGISDYYGEWEDLDIWQSVAGTDYQDEIFGRTGNQVQYNVNASGGTKQFKYNVGYTHSDEKSIMQGSGYNKDNINAKIKTELSKWLTLDFQARLSYQVVNGLSSGSDANDSNASTSIVANAVRYRPVNPLTYNNEDDDTSAGRISPLQRLLGTYRERRKFNQNYNAGLSWKPTKQITFRSEFGYTWNTDNTDQVWNGEATRQSNLGYQGRPQAMLTKKASRSWRNANTLTYDNKTLFGSRDRINVLIGQETSSSSSRIDESTSVNFPSSLEVNEILSNIGMGTALPTFSEVENKDNMVSFFGRINYTLKDKYLFTVTARADGSSKFAKGNQWGFFPSAAFAWRISDEPFMTGTHLWMSNLKLRLSMGTAGNNRISSGLTELTYALSGNTDRSPFFGETSSPMFKPEQSLYNPDLKWETTITRNLGIDYGFLGNRISGSLDFYWNTTKDLLMRTEIPSIAGYNYQYQNFGQTSNKGVEFMLKAVLFDTRKFSLNFNFNIAYNRNKIDKLNQQGSWQNSNWAGSNLALYEDFRIEEGGRLGEIWGYKTNGFFTAYDPVSNPDGELILNGTSWVLKDGVSDNSPTITGGNYYPGGLKLQCDENGNPIKQRLGNTIANTTGGFGFDGHIGNVDFNVFFNYSLGNKLINGTKLMSAFYANSSSGYSLNDDFTLSKRYALIDPETGLNLVKPGSWNTLLSTYGGENAVIRRLNQMNSQASIYNPATATTMQLTDYAVEDASFLRLNNLTIGYTLPKAWIKKCLLENVRVYFTGYNLFVITNYSGADPEVDTSSKRNLMTPGVDYAAYPKSRLFLAGINVTF